MPKRVNFVMVVCSQCGVEYGFQDSLVHQRLGTRGTFVCPNGHERNISEREWNPNWHRLEAHAVTCTTCGVEFGMQDSLYKLRVADMRPVRCPNKHFNTLEEEDDTSEQLAASLHKTVKAWLKRFDAVKVDAAVIGPDAEVVKELEGKLDEVRSILNEMEAA